MSRNTYKQSFAHMGPGTIAVKAFIDLSVKNKSFMSRNTYPLKISHLCREIHIR